MIETLCYRIIVIIINILLPPLAVLMVAGPGWDFILNCILFLLAIIPSHIHGFYITCTYFHRRHKVKHGKYPGGPKAFIESKEVINGGASDREVNHLYHEQYDRKRRR